MFKFTVTLPTTQHDNSSNIPAIKEIKREIADKCGGYSSCTIEGGWVDAETGHLYEEPSIMVWTFIQEHSAIDALLERSQTWANELQQIELLVTIDNNIDVLFVADTREKAVA